MAGLAGQKAKEVASMVKTYGETHANLVTPQDIMVIGADTVFQGRRILSIPVFPLSFWMLPERRAHMEFKGNVRFMLTKLTVTIIMLLGFPWQ